MKKHTKGKLSIIKNKYERHPKEIIIGIGISEKLHTGIYSEVLFNTILPDSDKEYIEQHEQIKADCEYIVKCWNMHDELLGMLIKISNIENHAFTLKGFDVNRLKSEINIVIKKATS